MLDSNLKSQLQGYLERISQPVEIVASLDDGEKSHDEISQIFWIDCIPRSGYSSFQRTMVFPPDTSTNFPSTFNVTASADGLNTVRRLAAIAIRCRAAS